VRLRPAVLLALLPALLGRQGSLLAQEAAPAPQEAAAPAPESPAPIVEAVEISNNHYLQRDTLLYYVSTKPGDRYDEKRIKDDFRRLWDTGFLDDGFVDVRNGTKGKIVVFSIVERKRVQVVDYRGSKAVTTSNIDDKLKEKEATIKLDTFLDLGKIRRVEAIIKDMLQEKSRPFGTVTHDVKSIGASGVQISFKIDDGPNTRVKEIHFNGNHIFADGTLKHQMKKIKERTFWTFAWITGKSTFTEDKWQEDQEKLTDFYLDHGYVTASVGEAKVSYFDGVSGFFKKKPTKWMRLDIPVIEGEQYRVGKVSFEGLTVFKEDSLRPIFKLEEGEVYRDSQIKKGYEKLRDFYGQLGYFQWTGQTRRKPDPERKVVDLTLVMQEDKRYYVGKIAFTGNDTTRDKVVRREIFINEGDAFNTEALKFSIKRLNQLGYFRPVEAPQFSPSSQGEDKLDIHFKLEEQNRNQFTFGGGVSGLEGAFVNASFSTSNFLGLGETLSLSAQTGSRTKNYQVALNEPYLFDRNITAGIDLFKRKIIYDTFQNTAGYTQEGTGITLTTGMPVGRSSKAFASYAYEIVNITQLTAAELQQLNQSGINTNPAATTLTPQFDPFLFGQQGKRIESRIGPSIIRNTVDSPFTPRSGNKQTVSMIFAGGPLGGNVNYVKPEVELIQYLPERKRLSLGLRGDVAWIKPYGNSLTLPLYQRFFLGGENQIRGYDIRTVGPVDSQNRSLGGNKYVLLNAEQYIDIIGPLRLVFFFDAGQAFLENESIDPRKFRTSTGAEIRFIMPVLNVPFRLIYAINPNKDTFQPHSAFKFSVGTTF
jgi:outer membrane protein insertion porin family